MQNRLWIVGLHGLQRGKLTGVDRLVAECMLKLRGWEVRRKQRFFIVRRLLRRTVSNGHRRDVLLDLRGGNLLSFDGIELERVSELLGGPIPGFVGVVFLFGMRCGKLARVYGLDHQRVCQLRDREVCGRCRCVGMSGLRIGSVPNHDRVDGLF